MVQLGLKTSYDSYLIKPGNNFFRVEKNQNMSKMKNRNLRVSNNAKHKIKNVALVDQKNRYKSTNNIQNRK